MIYKLLCRLLRLFLPAERYARFLGVRIGKHNLVGKDHWSTEPYLITIGNHTQITEGVRFYTHGGANVLRSKFPDFDYFGKIVVEDWAYIGSHSHIMSGVVIGEGALVAAGSVVTKSVPPWTVVGGNPARIICSVEEYEARNLKYNVSTKRFSYARKKSFLQKLDESKFITKPQLK